MYSAALDKRVCTRLKAFTLVEIVLSILILMVLVNGVLGYQYLSARDVKIAEVHTAAGRLGTLMLQSWKGGGGQAGFDPVAAFGAELDIRTSGHGPSVPEGFSFHGRYRVRMNDVCFFVTLAKANATEQRPATLHASVAWRKDYGNAALDGTEKPVQLSCYVMD
jgi:type II secretory pathway pseudopilin PulG